jgi:hypothetical protein
VPSQDGTHPGQDLAQIERLRNVIVGTELKADDAVNGVAYSLNHNDRHISAGAYLTRKAQAVVAAKCQIKRDKADGAAVERGARRIGIGSFDNSVAFTFEARPQQPSNLWFVVNDENFRSHVGSSESVLVPRH